MKHEEVLDWIDSANPHELRTPPAEVKAALGRDGEAERYHELSVMLTRPTQRVNLLSRFSRAAAGRKSPARKPARAGRLCAVLGTAVVVAACVLFVTLSPNRYRRNTNEATSSYTSPLELTYGIANNFGIENAGLTGGESSDGSTGLEAGALDYCYAVTLF